MKKQKIAKVKISFDMDLMSDSSFQEPAMKPILLILIVQNIKMKPELLAVQMALFAMLHFKQAFAFSKVIFVEVLLYPECMS